MGILLLHREGAEMGLTRGLVAYSCVLCALQVNAV